MQLNRRKIRGFSPADHGICPSLLAGSIALVFVLAFMNPLPASQGGAAGDSGHADPRWLPWIGSWRLVSDTANPDGSDGKSKALLYIQPAGASNSVTIKSTQNDKVLLEETIVVTGARQPLMDETCAGWYQYSWSENGKRLLFASESSCRGELPRRISGISAISGRRHWLDIQLMQSGDNRAMSIRKYERTTGEAAMAEQPVPGALDASRFAQEDGFTVDEIVELSRKIEPGVLEAALILLPPPSRINATKLRRLADAGVPPQLADLMVALSYPDKYTVTMNRIVPVQRPETAGPAAAGAPYAWLPFGYWSLYGPFSSWYWSPAFYGYWGPDWYYPEDYGRGRDRDDGRLVNGRGYSKVDLRDADSRPRYARPRAEAESYRGYQPSSASSRSTSASPSYSSTSGTSSSSGSGSTAGSSGSSSGGSSPSASPGGYHSGGGHGTAKPRE